MGPDRDTAAIYAASGLGGRLPWGRVPAVLVVDLARAFTDPSEPLGADLSATVEATRRVLDVARDGRAPVLFTTIAYDPADVGRVLWMVKGPALARLLVGSPLVEIDSRLGRREGEPVISKKGASAFFETALQDELSSRGVDTVVLCGASTSGCIRATAIDLMQRGWPAVVPRPCVGDRAPEAHDANLVDIDAKYGDVVDLAEVLSYLRRGGSSSTS